MEEQKSIDWREEVSDSSRATLKIQDGETVEFVFTDEGRKFTHVDFGTSIVFELEKDKEPMNWYVSEHNYDLLRQIKALGKLVGLKVKVNRTGSKKSDTRYTIEKA